MKVLITLLSFLFSVQALAGGGMCTDCYDAYLCADSTLQVKVTIQASYGIEFTGAMGSLSYARTFPQAKDGEYFWLEDGKATISGDHLVLPFTLTPLTGSKGKVFDGDSVKLLLPSSNWNEVPRIQGIVTRAGVETEISCKGSGFDEGSEIEP